MDIRILKSLLSFDFYNENKSNLSKNLFEDEIQDAYVTISQAHEKHQHDLIPADIMALWQNQNPVATRSDQEAFAGIVDLINTIDPLSPPVVAEVIQGLWQRRIGTRIANLGIEVADGNTTGMERLHQLLNESKEGFMPTDSGEPTTKDIHELLAGVTDDNRWEFNISTLSRHVYGIGAREFGCVFALPETGKTAFLVSICTGPGGFCEQGAKVIYLGNEEDTGKMAELDLCIGIGKHEAGDVDDSEPDTSRYLTVSKNKLSGWHGTVICNIQPEISRYVE